MVEGLLSGLGGGMFGAASAAANAKLQYKYAKRMALKSPSWNRKGLKAAGLNPILAANPSGGSPSAGMPSGQAPDIAGSASKMADVGVKQEQEKVARNQADITAAMAAQERNRMNWSNMTHNFLRNQPKDGFLIRMAAANAAGVPTKDLGEAGVLHMLLGPKSPTPRTVKPKSKTPEYMGVPIWR